MKTKYARENREEKMELDTKRLRLRPFRDTDAAALYAIAKDPRVADPAGWMPHTSETYSLQIIRDVLSGPTVFALELKENGQLAGCAGLTMPGDSFLDIHEGEAELGYWISPSLWGLGLVTEAACRVVRFGFEQCGLKTIWCAWFDGNKGSERVQEKCGFAYQYTMEDLWWIPTNDIRTEHISRLTREEFEHNERNQS